MLNYNLTLWDKFMALFFIPHSPRKVGTYYNKYYPETNKGYFQTVGNVTEKYVAIKGVVKGRWPIVKILKAKSFSDFGRGCCSVDYKATKFVIQGVEEQA